MNKADFFKKVAAAAPANMHGLYVSVMLAQAALESGYGTSWISKPPYYNLFGIKADSSWKGARVNAATHEYINGAMVPQNSDFRAYNNYRQSVKDYITFLENNSRYRKNGVFDAKTPEQEAKALQAAGYATAPNYANTLISIIETNGLKEYDKGHAGTASLIVAGVLAAIWIITENFIK